MEMIIKPEIFFYAILTILLSAVAYFLKQLHSDFKRVEKDVAEVKTTTALIKTEFKGIIELMNQKIKFLEKQIAHFETFFFNKTDHGNKANELG